MRGVDHVTAGVRAFWRIHRRHPPAPEREKTAEASTRKIRGRGGGVGSLAPALLAGAFKHCSYSIFTRLLRYFRFKKYVLLKILSPKDGFLDS
jgi:hypothetical protein